MGHLPLATNVYRFFILAGVFGGGYLKLFYPLPLRPIRNVCVFLRPLSRPRSPLSFWPPLFGTPDEGRHA